MKKPTLWLAVIIITVASAGCRTRVPYRGGGVTTAPPPSTQIAPGWADVRQPAAGFACQMPAQPRIETQAGHSEDGAAYQSVRARAEVPYGTFGMIVTQWEGGFVGDPLEHAHGLAESVFEITETPDHRARRVSIPGFYAREDTGHASGGGFFALRQFVGRERIYVAVAVVRNDPTGLRAAEQFMQSIALDRRDALLPYGDATEPVPIYLPDADFSVRMPPLAERRSEEIEVDGATTDAWVFESRHAGGVYRVRVILFSNGSPRDALELVSAALTLGEPGRYVHASGFPGRVYSPGGDRRVRAFVTAQRVYVVEVAGASALGQPAADAFFDSFRIM